MSANGLVALIFVVALFWMLVTANRVPPIDPIVFIAVILTFTVTFGVFLVFGSSPIGALLAAGFASLVAAVRIGSED